MGSLKDVKKRHDQSAFQEDRYCVSVTDRLEWGQVGNRKSSQKSIKALPVRRDESRLEGTGGE